MRFYCKCGCGHYLFVHKGTVTTVRDTKKTAPIIEAYVRAGEPEVHTAVDLTETDRKAVATLLMAGE